MNLKLLTTLALLALVLSQCPPNYSLPNLTAGTQYNTQDLCNSRLTPILPTAFRNISIHLTLPLLLNPT